MLVNKKILKYEKMFISAFFEVITVVLEFSVSKINHLERNL